MYYISKNVKTITNKNKVIVGNLKTGQFFKVNSAYYKALERYIKENGEIEKLNEYITDETVLSNLNKLFDKLCEIKVILQDNQTEKEELDKVIINCTNRCNLECIHCCKSSSIREKDILSKEDIKRIIDTVIRHDPKLILFTGGEPLIRRDMIEILKYTHINFKGKVVLNSNGTLINKNNVDEIIRNVDNISISLDGVDEKSSEKIRGKGAFTKAINTIKLLQSRNFKKICASMVITKENENLIEEFKKMCTSLNITPLLRKFIDLGRGYSNEKVLRGSIESMVIECDGVSCQQCKPGEREIYIDNDGNIYPCQIISDKEFSLGNILKDNEILEKVLSNKDNIYVAGKKLQG